jgi:hypothetical protein
MNPASIFPKLTPDNHQVRSPATITYNCVAWAMQDSEHWWEPGVFWRPDLWPPDDSGIGTLEAAFKAIGYVSCERNATLEAGFEKVALYALGSSLWTHAARQLSNGKWTSKLGKSRLREMRMEKYWRS